MCGEGGEWCVIVPTKVVEGALSHAAGIAGVMLTNEVPVTTTEGDGDETLPAVERAVREGAKGGLNSPPFDAFRRIFRCGSRGCLTIRPASDGLINDDPTSTECRET